MVLIYECVIAQVRCDRDSGGDNGVGGYVYASVEPGFFLAYRTMYQANLQCDISHTLVSKETESALVLLCSHEILH